MDNIISGVIGIFLVVVFLVFYMIRVPAIPLLIIFTGVMAMIFYDFYESLGGGNGNSSG